MDRALSRLRWALAIAAIALAASAASAQSGGLTVTVSDSSGLPLPGATVTIGHELGYVKETALITDANGAAEFPVLRPGRGYTITVSFSGFGTRRFTSIHIVIGGNQHLDVVLAGGIEERLRVVAEGDVVDLEETAQTTRFSDEFMNDLPVAGRFYQNVLTLTPGVQDHDGDGSPNVHGSRERDFKAIVSGVANVDPLTGQQMSQVNPNSIEEMQVITAGAGVEFSRAQGGFARIIQKQGSNEFEGVVEMYYRSSKLDKDGAAPPSVVPDPAFDWYQGALQLSGPLVKDKLWYRLSHEWIERDIPINVTSAIEVMTDDQEIHSDQLTWQLSPRNKVAYQFQSDPREINNVGVTSVTTPESSQARERTSDVHSMTWTASVSPRVLVESQVAWQDLNTKILPATTGLENDCVTSESFLSDAYCFNLETGEASGSFYRTLDDHSQRLTVRSQAEIFGGRFWGMSHQVKVGFLAENERYFRFLERKPDIFRAIHQPMGITIGGELVRPEPRLLLYVRAAVPQHTNTRATGTNWGLYAEDLIRPLDNLSIRLGVRLDREEINSRGFTPIDAPGEAFSFLQLAGRQPTGSQANFAARNSFTAFGGLFDFAAGLAAIVGEDPSLILTRLSTTVQQSRFWNKTRSKENIAITNTNISPAIAVSWDPWNDNKTRIAATARRYYDKIFLNVPLIELEPMTTTMLYEARRVQGTINQYHQPQLFANFDPTVNTVAVDRDLRTPYQDEFTFSVEREVATETSIALSYINRKFRDQLQDTDINHLPADFGHCLTPTLLRHVLVAPVSPGDPDYVEGVAPGDGLIDDCGGRWVYPACGLSEGCRDHQGRELVIEVPDGIPDLYLQNPGWGDINKVGNLNSVDYEAFVLALTRRQYRGWEMQLSYTWSEAIGDGEDFNQFLGDDRSLQRDEVGHQAYDQRHVVKLNATTITPWGIRLGAALSWQSGLPYSLLNQEISYYQVPPHYLSLGSTTVGSVRQKFETGRRNDQRNTAHWNADLKVAREFNFAGRLNMQVSAEVFNLLNDDTYTIFEQINGTNAAVRRFGRRWQLGLKMAF